MKVNVSVENYYQYAFPMPTVLITCNDDKGKTNIVTVAWHTTLSRKPPFYGVSLASKRYSYELIKKTKEFAINFIPYELGRKAHFCGTHSGRRTDKAKETNLQMEPAKKIRTPILTDAYVNFECTLHHEIPVGDHILLVGEVVAVHAEEHAFINDILNTDHTQPLWYLGNNRYTTLDKTKVFTF